MLNGVITHISQHVSYKNEIADRRERNRGKVCYQQSPMPLIWLSGPIDSMRKDFSQRSYVASFSRLQEISHGLLCHLRTVSDIRDTTVVSMLEEGMPLRRLACQSRRV